MASQDRTVVTLEDVAAVRDQAMARVLGARRPGGRATDVATLPPRAAQAAETSTPPPAGGDCFDLAAFVTTAERDADQASVVSPEFTVRVCGAAGGCPMAVGDVVAAREAMLEELRVRDAATVVRAKARGPLLAHHRLKVSISGCPNSCSQPQIADFGLVAREVPVADHSLCTRCGACVDACDEAAVSLDSRTGSHAEGSAGESGPVLDRGRCVGCGACVRVCPTGALTTGESGWRVMAGGRLGRHPRLARDLASCVDLDGARARLGHVVDLWGREGLPNERVGVLLERVLPADATWLDPESGSGVR